MKNLLFVTSSLMGGESRSVGIGRELVDALVAGEQFSVTEREVGGGEIPHLSGEYLQAVGTAPEQRSVRQTSLAAIGDVLIEELEAADVIVIAAPMYNFTIPSTLKAWFDHVTRAGRTFRYTAEGRPEGLLKNKKVYVIVSRGGFYGGDSPAKAVDFQEPYLRWMLGFNGLSDVTFIHVEGQKVSPVHAEAGQKRAREFISSLVPLARAA